MYGLKYDWRECWLRTENSLKLYVKLLIGGDLLNWDLEISTSRRLSVNVTILSAISSLPGLFYREVNEITANFIW